MFSQFRFRLVVSFTLLLVTLLSAQAVVSAPPIPNPVLFLTGTETYPQAGKTYVKYHYDVFNKDAFPATMFAPAPDLPPCGKNTKSARTWIDIFDAKGNRLNGFCALGKPADLNQLWFALEADVVPPSYIYLEMNDRQTNTRYKSNLADTTN
jgi:hypothetical protein